MEEGGLVRATVFVINHLFGLFLFRLFLLGFASAEEKCFTTSPFRIRSCLNVVAIKRDIPSDDVKDPRPIRERLPLPDLQMMRRMMQNIHQSNQNAEIRDRSASKRKLEVVVW